MKVMHVTYDMRIGGTEMVIKNIIEGNSDANIEMSIYCIEAPLGPWGEDLKASGTQITVEERQPGFDKSLISKIRRHIKDNDIDILHCHQYTPWVYGTLAAAFTKTKVIFTEHGRFYPDSTNWKRRIVNPLLLTLTSRVTAISKATKDALSEFEFIPAHTIEVVYNGIEPLEVNTTKHETIRHLGLPNDAFIFGTVARMDPIKNQIMMVNAFAEVTKSAANTYLVFVGDGEMRSTLESLVETLGLEDKVVFTGYQSNPKALIEAFDVFLLSSLSEGTSMTLLEAMSLKKPCVVTDAGGNAEVIRHNHNGFVCKNDNLGEFTENMLKIKNKEQILQFSSNAFTTFNQNFTVTGMLTKYQHLYREILDDA